MANRPAVTLYHNPRCTKSRQTLDLLRERDVAPVVIEYLKEPPDEPTLWRLLGMLGMRPAELLRRRETFFTTLDLGAKLDDDDALIAAMIAHPILIERPIVVCGGKAKIGRPPEGIVEIL